MTLRTHQIERCAPPCPIHHPSDHHMKNWPQAWRADRGITERTCKHGIGHPDPDDLRVRTGQDNGIHGCDGCCRKPEIFWLLDVDGVVNADMPRWGEAPFHGEAADHRQSYVIRWSPTLMKRIRDLARSDKVNIVWCTTWCCDADQLEKLFHLPRLGRAFTERINGYAASIAKIAAAKKIVADGDMLIWTDDNEVPEPGSPLYQELTSGPPALLIRPLKRYGLTREHMDQIEQHAGNEPHQDR